MVDQIKEILEENVDKISKGTEIDINSEKIKLLEHSEMFIKAIIKNEDLTDTAIDNNISKSQLLKPDYSVQKYV